MLETTKDKIIKRRKTGGLNQEKKNKVTELKGPHQYHFILRKLSLD